MPHNKYNPTQPSTWARWCKPFDYNPVPKLPSKKDRERSLAKEKTFGKNYYQIQQQLAKI